MIDHKAELDRACRSALYRLAVATLALNEAMAWRNPGDNEVLGELLKAGEALRDVEAFRNRALDAHNAVGRPARARILDKAPC